MGDIGLWAIVAAFVGWEAFAHFVARNRGSHTLSNRIWALEARYPIARLGVGAALGALAAHLLLR